MTARLTCRQHDFAPGSVWIAGAGPGDPELLTIAALRAIETADIIVHDALVSSEILALAPAETTLVPVGKRAGGVHTPQLSINATLIDLARRNHRVLRLKGGDPFVFGRGGEECLALAAENIPVRVIPGISAGIGATTAMGMPITHRGIARSVVFATGEAGAAGHEVDWAALARAADTLVLYMARNRIGTIAAALIEAGRAPDEPLAFLLDATTPRAETVTTTLAEAEATATTLRPAATLIVIGEVVSLASIFGTGHEAAPAPLLTARG